MSTVAMYFSKFIFSKFILSKFFDFLVASSHEVEQCKTL